MVQKWAPATIEVAGESAAAREHIRHNRGRRRAIAKGIKMNTRDNRGRRWDSSSSKGREMNVSNNRCCRWERSTKMNVNNNRSQKGTQWKSTIGRISESSNQGEIINTSHERGRKWQRSCQRDRMDVTSARMRGQSSNFWSFNELLIIKWVE